MISDKFKTIVNTETNFDILSIDTVIGLGNAFSVYQNLNQLSGHYLEFGIFQGYSFLHAYRNVLKLGLDHMHLFGFDSFAGLPEPSEDERLHYYNYRDYGYTAPISFSKGQFACCKDDVIGRLLSHGVDLKRIDLIEGFFEKRLTNNLLYSLNIQEVAIALIDCDLFESTRYALHFMEPIVRDGTIILFDDWNIHGEYHKGERKAFTQFLQQNPKISPIPLFSFGWHGQAFMLNISD